MSTRAEDIVSQALDLPVQARAFVAEKLIESLDAEPETQISPAWRDEIRRRCREIDDGSAQLRNAEDVFARAFASLE